MILNHYQIIAKTTAIFPNDLSLVYLLFGLSGEVLKKFKKLMRDKNQDFARKGDNRQQVLSF